MQDIIRRSVKELERLFVDAYERLLRSCILYDQGHLSEAPDIAKETCNFIYDYGTSSISILEALGIKETIQLVDSTQQQLKGLGGPGTTHMCLHYLLLDATIGFSGMDYQPILDKRGPYPRVSFTAWWDGTVLSRDIHTLPPPDHRERISREELVRFCRHCEGGSHVSVRHHPSDENEKLLGAIRGAYVDGYMMLNGGPPETAADYLPVYATVRQIGFEMVLSLQQIRPDLTARANLRPQPGPRMRPGKR